MIQKLIDPTFAPLPNFTIGEEPSVVLGCRYFQGRYHWEDAPLQIVSNPSCFYIKEGKLCTIYLPNCRLHIRYKETLRVNFNPPKEGEDILTWLSNHLAWSLAEAWGDNDWESYILEGKLVHKKSHKKKYKVYDFDVPRVRLKWKNLKVVDT